MKRKPRDRKRCAAPGTPVLILKLRSDYQAQQGAEFSLQKFHDEMLKHGTPPIPVLREIMLKDKAKWGEVL